MDTKIFTALKNALKTAVFPNKLDLRCSKTDIRTIINESVDSIDNSNIPDMIITPKEIDFVIDKMSDLISICINKTLYDF